VARYATTTGIRLVPIAAGSFAMGSPEKEAGRKLNEGPRTFVTLSKGFFLGATVVTQGQYESVMGCNPSHFAIAGPDAPVEQVTWDDAMTFCRKLTERERASGRLPDGLEVTLPTEAQWEYACRAGTAGPYPGKTDAMAWKGSKGDPTHPVGRLQPNAWGLYDLAGEVRQFCLDFYFGDTSRINGRPHFFGYTGGVVSDPIGVPEYYNPPFYLLPRVVSIGPVMIAHVVRGPPAVPLEARSAARFAVAASDANPETGFRVALVQVEDRSQSPPANVKKPASPDANGGK
jgi:formylglycine-generating enzyme required for sulfatase activity